MVFCGIVGRGVACGVIIIIIIIINIIIIIIIVTITIIIVIFDIIIIIIVMYYYYYYSNKKSKDMVSKILKKTFKNKTELNKSLLPWPAIVHLIIGNLQLLAYEKGSN